ncbi:MAG: hypothetical protein M0024_04080 [Nitrospiraceae bacterium]|nr:hypothetical protein [Nitrospiraceae bacterium]
MATEDKVAAKGVSGAQYDFDVYRWGTEFKAVGGIYLVLKRQMNGKYDLLYVGQTGDLSERFDGHHKASCFTRSGKTHIAVKGEGSEQKRLSIEADLINNYRPGCNG